MSVVRMIAPPLLGTSLLLGAVTGPSTARADVSLDQARVISAQPVYRIVSQSVPTEHCSLVETPVVQTPARQTPGYRSFTGPILGAVIGGAIGNAVGHSKTNKKVGTAVGAVVGGTIGRDIQRRMAEERYRTYPAGYEYETVRYESARYETREVCETIYETVESRELDGYDVTYRYAGQTHTARMDEDPGRYLNVRVRVTPA